MDGIGTDAILLAMIRRRNRHDPLERCPLQRWLVVWDMQFNVLEATELPPNTDLRATMHESMQRWAQQGWNVEGDARFGSFFCHRAGARRLIAISPLDPARFAGAGPSWRQPCPDCGE